MSEEELHGPSDQTDFKMDVNGQVQVQVLALQWSTNSCRGKETYCTDPCPGKGYYHGSTKTVWR